MAQEPTHVVTGPPTDFVELAKQAGADSERWFGDTGITRNISYMTLALCGETGELANIIKKIERKSLDARDPKVRYDVVMEVVDIFTYLLIIADILHVDLKKAYDTKRGVNEKRFTEQRAERERNG